MLVELDGVSPTPDTRAVTASRTHRQPAGEPPGDLAAPGYGLGCLGSLAIHPASSGERPIER